MADKPKMFRAYSIIPRKGQDDFWLNLGVAFPHDDGNGFNVLLQALPLPTGVGECKLVLREYEADEAEKDARDGKSAKRR